MNLDRVRELADAYEKQFRADWAAQRREEDNPLALYGYAAILAGSRVMAYPRGREVAQAALRDLVDPVTTS